MAKRSFANPSWTTAATANGSTLTASSYQAIGASTASTGLLVSEIYIGGQATSSMVQVLVFARDSTLGATLTTLADPVHDGPMNSLTAAAQVGSLTFIAATTNPTRTVTTTSSVLNLSMNAFGGIVRWVAYPGEEWGIIGVTASISESSLSGTTGTAAGLVGSHIIYEAY
jgi:hypothetical protein